MFRKVMRWLLWIFISAVGLLIFVALVLFAFTWFNRDRIVNEIKTEIGRELNGEIVADDISFNVFKNFPATSLNLKNFSARDSMYIHHKMESLHAENVFVEINFKDLFESKIAIENISLENGSLYIFTDTSGYSNKYLFQNNLISSDNKVQTKLNKIQFKNFRVVYRDVTKNKFFNVFFNNLKCNLSVEQNIRIINTGGDGEIKFLGFNTEKGFYGMNTPFKTKMLFEYNPSLQKLSLPVSTVYLNNSPIEMKGDYNFSDVGSFSMEINSNRIFFNDVVKMVMQKTAKKLSQFKFLYPVKLKVLMEGSMEYKSIPKVKCTLIALNNKLLFNENELKSCSFTATYINFNDSLKPFIDENSSVTIKQFDAMWEGFPLKSDNILIQNLIQPHLTALFHSSFPLTQVNNLTGTELFNFSGGTGTITFDVDAFPVEDNLNASVQGNILIKNGSALYGPREMPFDHINGKIFVTNSDVRIDEFSCTTGSSTLVLSGKAPGLIDFLKNVKKDAKITWTIKSPFVDLNDFTPFLSHRKSLSDVKVNKGAKFFKEGTKLDLFLNASILDMHLDVSKIVFRNFTAIGFSGEVKLIKDSWKLDNLRFNHADGNVQLNGNLNEINSNLFAVHVETVMKSLNINKVFKSFDNFGQSTVTDQNIDGVLTANASLDFNMNNKTVIRQSSLKGSVELSITDGGLKGFQPMGKLVKFIFPKRDFSDIKFSEISNSFAIDGNEIYFDRMKVNSSVILMYLEGHYFLDGKTDMDIQVPLANLKKREWDELSDDVTDKGDKGMNVYIKAVTDDKGELKFKYDPLKKIKSKNTNGFSKFKDRFK